MGRWMARTEKTRLVLEGRVRLLESLLGEARQAVVAGDGYTVDARMNDIELELGALRTRVTEDWPFDQTGRMKNWPQPMHTKG